MTIILLSAIAVFFILIFTNKGGRNAQTKFKKNRSSLCIYLIFWLCLDYFFTSGESSQAFFIKASGSFLLFAICMVMIYIYYFYQENKERVDHT